MTPANKTARFERVFSTFSCLKWSVLTMCDYKIELNGSTISQCVFRLPCPKSFPTMHTPPTLGIQCVKLTMSFSESVSRSMHSHHNIGCLSHPNTCLCHQAKQALFVCAMNGNECTNTAINKSWCGHHQLNHVWYGWSSSQAWHPHAHATCPAMAHGIAHTCTF